MTHGTTVHRADAALALGWEHGHRRGDLALRGAAADLLLVLMGRLAPADRRVEVLGDAGLLEHWVRHATF